MSIKDIKDKILESATQEKNKVIEEANNEIKKIKENAQSEIESIQNSIMDQYEQEAELAEKKIITEAKLESNKEILSEKQAIIEDIFQEAENRIKNLDNEKYKKFMEKLILDNVENGDETIYLGNNERKEINQDFINNINKKLQSKGKKGELRIAKKTLSIKGGIVLGTEEIRKNASLDVIFDNIRDKIETRLNHFLFQENEE
jgi:V/A-type H+-transporting ATPase subunit E